MILLSLIPDHSLVTNLPKEAMAFFDYPFRDELQSFVTHGQVLDYLRDYSEHYDIRPLVKLACPVLAVRPIAEGDKTKEAGPLGKWEVVYREARTGSESFDVQAFDGTSVEMNTARERVDGTTKSALFEAVCVCSGHFEEAFTPPVEGFEGFQGMSMHSQTYNRPDLEAFVSKRVLIVGSRSSGTDIAREVSSVGEVSTRGCNEIVILTLQLEAF